MNAKSRIVSVLAAAIISMGMIGGATAQQFDSEWTSADLSDPGAYICTVDMWVDYGSFGSWEFDGAQYNPVTATTMVFLSNIYGGSMTGCFVNVSFDGLYGPGGWIDPWNFSAFSYYQGTNVDPAWFGDIVPSGLNGPNVSWYDFYYTLNQVPSYLTPGQYQGGMYVWVSNAA
jgi:hypothetical protein